MNYKLPNLNNMAFTDLSQIITCINKWKNVITDESETIDYLSCGNSFLFTRTQGSSDNLHVYPGAYEDENGKQLYMFLISAEDDREENTDAYLFNAITQCKIEPRSILSTDPDPLPESQALERIHLWNEEYTEWVKNQIQTPDEIFQAFNMPSSFITSGNGYTSFFGLKRISGTMNYSADLITLAPSPKGTPSYYDTVRPVPPFDATYPQSAFFLLNK